MREITQTELDKLQQSGKKVRRKKKKALKRRSTDAALAPEQGRNPAPADQGPKELEPMAAMSASLAARDRQFAQLVHNNTKAIQKFAEQLEDIKQSRPKRGPWRHQVVRHKSNLLIDYIDSFPIETEATK